MSTLLLTNRVLTIGQTIESKLVNCREFSIATAFIDSSMISILEESIKKNKQLGKGRLLIGLMGCLIREADLKALQELALKNTSNISIRISINKFFHWKYYSFRQGNSTKTYIGSANFTQAGMKKNAEVMAELKYSQTEYKNMDMEFNKEWNNAGSIVDFDTNEYEEAIVAYSNGGKTGNEAFFKNTNRLSSKKITSEKAFVLYLSDTCSAETNRKIENLKPSWQSTSYFVLSGKREYSLCKEIGRILIFEKLPNKKYCAYWARYIDDTITQTQDGRYFISYDICSKIKMLNPTDIETIEYKSGLNIKLTGWSKYWLTHRVMGKKQVKTLSEILKLKIPA